MYIVEGRHLRCVFFFQAEDGIRYLVRSRGLGDVYKRQALTERIRRIRQRLRNSALPETLLAEAFAILGECLSLIHI